MTDKTEKPASPEENKQANPAPANASVNTPVVPDNAVPPIDRLAVLKSKADVMGISYSPNIGIDALAEKINAKLNGTEEKKEPEPSQAVAGSEAPKTKMQLRQEAFLEATRLIRCRITNMNPSKADLPGEIFTVSNTIVGEIKRYIPYGEQVDGWHVEKMMLDMLKERQFHQLRTKKGANGQILPEGKWVREFAIEELPPLTPEELRVLANKQAAAAGAAI